MERNEETEIDLVEIFMVLLHKCVIIIAATIICGTSVGLFSYYAITPTYESSSTMYIVGGKENSMVDLSALQIGTNLTKDYTALVTKRPIVEKVISNLGLDMTYEQMVKKVKAVNPADTRMITISVSDFDPDFTMNVANEFAKVIKEQVPELMQTTAPTIVEHAVIGEKTGPSNVKNAIIGALFGFVLSAGIIAFLFIKDDSIKTAEDAEKYLGLNTLASIPEDGGTDNSEKNKGKKKKGKIGGRK